MPKRIAVIAGDGIGPEITTQAVRALEQAGRVFGRAFEFVGLPAGGAAVDSHGVPLPEETLEACRRCDAILLGAVGGPCWDHLDRELRPESGLLALRKELGLFANIRPVRLHEQLRDASPLKSRVTASGIDLCIVRELTGGIYFGRRGSFRGCEGREAFDTESYTEAEIRRLARVTFALARKRRRSVVSVDKANVLESSRLWRAVMTEESSAWPDVRLDHMLVDNAAMQLIRDPGRFDVIAASNMFGDILSDEAAMLTGSIGLLPSSSLGEGRRGLYEPIHGSAPDIAGCDTANPLAAILSAALMLRLSFDMEAEAAAVEAAVGRALKRGLRTADIMSQGRIRVGTREMGEYVAQEIGAAAEEPERPARGTAVPREENP